jgi:hypothetical protein
MYTGENHPMREKPGKPEQKFDVASESILRIKSFKEASRNLVFFSP